MTKGCLVDTSILFAVSYPNDAHNTAASEVFDYLAELKIPAFTNVNIRAEFIQNQFQVMVPEGLADLYAAHGKSLNPIVYKKLQSNYTFVNEAKNSGNSYKFSVSKVNEWRDFLRMHSTTQSDAWFDFCRSYISHRVEAVWEHTCAEVNVNFLTLRGTDSKEWMTGPIEWKDASFLVGDYGIGSFDAMIINLFLNSHFQSLITADKELARVVESLKPHGKVVFTP
jgi:predicted nucleic acid-binding protein